MITLSTCTRCPLHKNRIKVVLGRGKTDNPIIAFIAEAPGKKEDEQGKPFIGAAGVWLTRILWYIGLSRDVVYITNVVKCRPPNNRDPKEEEIKQCLPFLKEEIRLIKPGLICTLGKHALSTVTGKDGVMKARGKLLWSSLFDLWVFPMLHPATLCYNKLMNLPKIKQDCNILRKLLKEEFQHNIKKQEEFG